jgi:hypothetical protein
MAETSVKHVANLKKMVAQFLQLHQHAFFFLMNAFGCIHMHPARMNKIEHNLSQNQNSSMIQEK